MFKTNEYFDGKVMSIAFENEAGKFTTGVMEDGDYEFSTSSSEEMTVVSGVLNALLPGESEWKTFAKGEVFNVASGVSFKVKAIGQTCYLCRYY